MKERFGTAFVGMWEAFWELRELYGDVGNVYGPQPADVNEHHFIYLIVSGKVGREEGEEKKESDKEKKQ